MHHMWTIYSSIRKMSPNEWRYVCFLIQHEGQSRKSSNNRQHKHLSKQNESQKTNFYILCMMTMMKCRVRWRSFFFFFYSSHFVASFKVEEMEIYVFINIIDDQTIELTDNNNNNIWKYKTRNSSLSYDFGEYWKRYSCKSARTTREKRREKKKTL